VGARELSNVWYFAEGWTGDGWLTFVSAANPGSVAANVTISYMLPDGSAVSYLEVVPPGARHTFVGHEDVPGSAFSVRLNSDIPIVAQQVLIDTRGLLAHGTVGAIEPKTEWFLAEGFTGESWLTFISIGNFGTQPAEVTATYEVFGGPPVERTIIVPPGARGTLAAHEIPTGVGPGQSFGVTIRADVPVVVQEVLIDPKPGVELAHSVIASPGLARTFAFSGGSSKPERITFISVMNPRDTDAMVEVVYYLDDGSTPQVRTQLVGAHSRATFASYDEATGIDEGHEFGVMVRSTGDVIAQKVMIDVVDYFAMPAGAQGPGLP
jgi:hypothetical protein